MEDGTADVPSEDGESASETRHFTVDATTWGQRLDRALAAWVPEFSRSYLQQRIAEGDVQVDGQPVDKSARKLHRGQKVLVVLRATAQSQAFVPEAMPIEVVYEDAHLRVIHKPAGLVVHPAPGHWSGTLLNGLLALDAGAALLPRAGIVHRLDKDTSGLMVVARTRTAMEALVRMIAAREVSRQYLALSHRPWSGPGLRLVERPIGRDPANRLRMAVVDLARHPGKEARTTLQLLAHSEAGFLVHCRLHTGRTHQIRVHMASVGMPLLGDVLYGGPADPDLPRQGLHAWRLALVHPVTGEALSWLAPLPADMQKVLARWGLGYNEADLLQAADRPDPD